VPSPHGFCTQKDLERVLKGLSTLQYFDIIVETLCVVLCIKYEDQLIELTHEGDLAGAKRAAEWATARIIDEFFNEGIDPELPLCEQLILCLEGLAIEEGEVCWRRAACVDPDVAMVVWGVDLPEDVAGMTLQRRNTKVTWYEWGAFAQPGIRCADSSHWTGPRLNPHTYGWRLGTKELAQKIGLRQHDGVQTNFRLPSFMADRPGESLVDPASVMITVDAPRRVDSMSSGAASPPVPASGLPALTLSSPPEGSTHTGGAKRKPHIRPQDPAARRELERLYQVNAMARAAQSSTEGELDDFYESEEDEEEEDDEGEQAGLQVQEQRGEGQPRSRQETLTSSLPSYDEAMEREETTPCSIENAPTDGMRRQGSSRVRRNKPGNGTAGTTNRSFPMQPPHSGQSPLQKPRNATNDTGEPDLSGNYEALKDRPSTAESNKTSPSLHSTNASTQGSKCCCIIT